MPIFGTHTNNHIESFNRVLKRRLKSTSHLSTCMRELMTMINGYKDINNKTIFNLRVKIPSTNSKRLQVYNEFINKLSNKSLQLLKEQEIIQKDNKYNVMKTNDTEFKLVSTGNSNAEHRICKNDNLCMVLQL